MRPVQPFVVARAVCSGRFALTGFVMAISLVASLASARAVVQQPFTASDFVLIMQPETATVQPGQVLIFDGILYNVSSQTANFGANISLYGSSSSPEIDGNNLFSSPYIGSINFSFFPVNQTIDPGGYVQFAFMTVQTLPTVPLGSVITTGTGNFLFQNIPPSTGNPFVDFFVPMSLANAVVAVPEPGTSFLLGLGILFIALARARRP